MAERRSGASDCVYREKLPSGVMLRSVTARPAAAMKKIKRRDITAVFFIDIFRVDGMPKNGKKKEKAGARKIQIYWTVLSTWYRFDYYENATVFPEKLLHGIRAVLHIPMGKAYKGYEKLCTRFKGKDTEYVRYRIYPLSGEKHTWKREWFKEAVYMPFENVMVYLFL